ncbi:type I restriction endonuclease subunit R [Haloferula rosea]|uniref:Type I restriction endonuclease subunit R n=1 Tax=Haloferula rosea TaxID=490093 RepID=A0A934RD71_9BACT|nr:type I restriction endonuclease [Haloferula rosea]MBK1826886.1 type I restriction endonuclease subunit R [Haloferula rosea]
MPTDTTEAALEACIERFLTGEVSTPTSNDGKVQEAPATYQAGKGVGYLRGQSSDFNAEFALDEAKFWQFLEATQADELAKLTYKADYRRQILERLHRKLKKDGIISVLKKGLDVDNAHFDLLYRLPYNDLNPEVKAKFESNLFSVTRQIYFSSADHKSVDMVLFLNGLPLATLELKNPWTGQNVNHAKKQYRFDRDPKETLFQFRRCLVHFAVDPDEVWMTTKLDGKSTYFLPFNKGHNHGKGNPPNPDGHKSAYLWQEILTRQSLTNIIEHYAKVTEEKDKKTGKVKQTLFFPRYHQLEVVRNILADVQGRGVGHRYLIQHSAGSGKSHSITWLGYQLVELYDKAGQDNLFDSVIVVTDRRVLDRQIDKNIKAFAEVKNILAHADSSADLRAHLENGKKLITTTIQKFPFIVDGIADMSDKRFAVIIDEAHSSQSGQAADKLNMSLGGNTSDEEPEDYQEKILEAMARRKMGQNASYFAFTATPKKATLEKFGTQNAEGGFDPFHLYSMKQAIEEDFILDVLANYTTYKSYYEVQKSIEDNPEFDTAKAQKKLRAYVEGHQETIDTKAALMVDHFLTQVVATKKLRGAARGMVVTRNIESAIRYFTAIQRELKEKNANFQAIVAFSGKKTVDGIEHTEESLNGFPSKDLPDMLSGKYARDNPRKEVPTYKLLVVANKYLTGFDEPLLHSMYVDKRLQGVLAVQALSRLNRCNTRMQKQDTFILDFYNTASEIKDAFDPFYTATSLSEPTDVNVLHDLKDALDDSGLYSDEDIETFNERFFNGEDAEKLHPIIDECVDRFNLIEDEEDKVDFKIKAKQFVKLYGQLACIIPFENAGWEKLYWFLKFLVPKLKVAEKDKEEIDELLDSIDLSTYGLERVHLNQHIGLDDSDTELEPENPNVRGYHDDGSEESPLDEIIRTFNERFFDAWDATPEEQRVKLINIMEHVKASDDYQQQVVDNPDQQNRRIALESLISKAVNQERKKDLDLYKIYAGDTEFKKAFEESIIRILSLHEKSKPA